MRLKAIIAGGGIGGLTTAIALRRSGFDAEIHERRAELREIDSAILLWPNATRILRELGVLEALLRKGAAVTHCEIRTWKDRPVKRWSVPKLSTPAVFIHRADLQAGLLAALAPGVVRLGQAVDGFEQDEGRVRVRFASGKTAEGDVLIGTDGLNSSVRGLLFGDRPPRYQGYTQWVAVVDGVHGVLEPGLKREWWGPGVRFGAAANGEGRMNWYLSVSCPAPVESAVAKSDLLEWVRDWRGPAEEIIRSTPEKAILKTDIWARPPLKAWGEGRITLLGDAAHPTSPNLGQGACMAIEDAQCLAFCLAENGQEPSTALRRYEKLRKGRTADTTRSSWLVGRMAQFSHPALVAARTVFLKAYPLALWERQLKSLYSYQVEP